MNSAATYRRELAARAVEARRALLRSGVHFGPAPYGYPAARQSQARARSRERPHGRAEPAAANRFRPGAPRLSRC